MEFLNPSALYALFLLPLLLIPYLIKRKPRQVVFSSLLLFQDLAAHISGRPWGRLRVTPLFFLQLVLLLLLILALGEPVFPVRLVNVAVVLDNSASMEALEGQKTRFQTAQSEIRRLLQDLSAKARVDIFLTAPRLARVGAAGLAPDSADAIIGSLIPYDLGEPAVDYGQAISNLARERSYSRVYFLTDHPVQGQSERIKVITVGRPRENLAITSFRVFQDSFVSSEPKAMVEVRSFSGKEEKIKLSLKAGGRVLSTRALTVKPGGSVQAAFEGFAQAPYYEAEIENNDALPLDNHRFAIRPLSAGLRILGISSRPEPLESLRSIPGLRLNVVSPAGYEKQKEEDNQLEVFYYSAPATLPQSNALFILPPAQNPLVTLEKSVSGPQVTGWREPHILTRYVNFSLFHPAYAHPMRALSFGESIIQCSEGALAVAVERGGYRYLVLGFDPLPFLGQKNLPVSIFTLNVLKWFYEGMGGSSSATGEPLNLGNEPEGAVLTNPKGEKFSLKATPSIFPRTFYQGIYEVAGAGKKELRAVNLGDVKESDLSHPTTVNLGESRTDPKTGSFLFFLWPYFLLSSLFLLFLEWYVSQPTYRSRHPRRQSQRAGYSGAEGGS